MSVPAGRADPIPARSFLGRCGARKGTTTVAPSNGTRERHRREKMIPRSSRGCGARRLQRRCSLPAPLSSRIRRRLAGFRSGARQSLSVRTRAALIRILILLPHIRWPSNPRATKMPLNLRERDFSFSREWPNE